MYSRNERLNELLKTELSVVLRSVKDPGVSGLLTVTDVKLSVDRKVATVYYSVLGRAEQRESTARALERSAMYIRALMRKRLSLKYIPQFVFSYDDTPLRATRIDKIIADLQKEREQ